MSTFNTDSVRRHTAVELRFVTNSATAYVSAADYDALATKLAELHQGEPVAWMYTRPEVEWPVFYDKRKAAAGWKEIPLYTHADAGEVERLREDLRTEKARGELLNDARIQAEEQQWAAERKLAKCEKDRKRLRDNNVERIDEVASYQAQLAERDALLRGLVEYADGLLADSNRAWDRAGRCAEDEVHEDLDYLKAVKLLSASAEPSVPGPSNKDKEQAAFEEWLDRVRPSGDCDSVHAQWLESHDYEDFVAELDPSAPVERDERAEFERTWSSTPVLRENKRTIAEKFWQARAALERKP